MAWTVNILNETVEAELDAVPADMRASFVRISSLIEEFGLQKVGMPHVRHLQDKLWEMRLKVETVFLVRFMSQLEENRSS